MQPAVVVVEDNDFDVKRIERGFQKLGQNRPIYRARDGVEALALLRGETEQAPPTQPLVILLDLNMPRMGGIEFLDELRQDENLRRLPVFVVTTSEFERDIELAHDRNVCGYIAKPRSSEEMAAILKTLSDFWQACQFVH